jgi:uncharacterized membrane protein YeiB
MKQNLMWKCVWFLVGLSGIGFFCVLFGLAADMAFEDDPTKRTAWVGLYGGACLFIIMFILSFFKI